MIIKKLLESKWCIKLHISLNRRDLNASSTHTATDVAGTIGILWPSQMLVAIILYGKTEFMVFSGTLQQK